MFEKEPCRCGAETDRPWGRERRGAVAPAPVAEVASSSSSFNISGRKIKWDFLVIFAGEEVFKQGL